MSKKGGSIVKQIIVTLFILSLNVGLFSYCFFPGIYDQGDYWVEGDPVHNEFSIEFSALGGNNLEHGQTISVQTGNWLTLINTEYYDNSINVIFSLPDNNSESIRSCDITVTLYGTNEFGVQYTIGSLVEETLHQFPASVVSPLQNMIDNAVNGQTLYLNAVTYTGYAVIENKDLTITGINPEQTVLKGRGYKPVVNIINSDVRFENLTIKNGMADKGAGVLGEQFSNIELDNVHIYDCISRSLNYGGNADNWDYHSAFRNNDPGSTTQFDNVLIYGNDIYRANASPTIVRAQFPVINSSTIVHENAYGSVMAGVPVVTNSIIQYKSSVGNYTNSGYLTNDSDIENVTGFNLINNPYFADSVNGDYSLKWDDYGKSDCIGTDFNEDGTGLRWVPFLFMISKLTICLELMIIPMDTIG